MNTVYYSEHTQYIYHSEHPVYTIVNTVYTLCIVLQVSVGKGEGWVNTGHVLGRFTIYRIALSHHAASRGAAKAEMDSILVSREGATTQCDIIVNPALSAKKLSSYTDLLERRMSNGGTQLSDFRSVTDRSSVYCAIHSTVV